MRKQEEPYLTGNLTAMIDVVFQLIIFFVCAISMQNNTNDDSITLTLAPNGTEVKAKDPREVNIDVGSDGVLRIARFPYSEREIANILKKLVMDNGNNQIPVIIRGDEKARHDSVKKVMDACAYAAIHRPGGNRAG